ncbi:MAG: response regulator, partial [Synergistaceae bacterium]|nr:response regulator [Synergistaceae bacterium]
MEKNLSSRAGESLLAAEAQIMEGFSEMESAIANIAFSVQIMLGKDESSENLTAYLTGTTDWLRRRENSRTDFLGVYGYIRGEFLSGTGMDPTDDYVPQSRPWYQLAVRSGGRTVFTAPYTDIRTGGTIISAAREIYDQNGHPIGIVALDVDTRSFSDRIVSLSLAEGGYGMITNQYLSILSHPEKEKIGLQIHEIAPDYRPISESLLRGEEVSAEGIRDTNGDSVIVFFKRLFNGWYVAVITPYQSYYRDVHYTAAVLSILGSILALILCYLLVRLSSARIRSDEENRSKSSFLARMSHEIRTPMNAIIGMSELALREELSPPSAAAYVSGISQAGHNLLSIINDVLDFSKIESGLLQIENAPYKMASVLNDVINVIRARVAEKHLLFLADVDSGIPGELRGDSARLRQILMNLLGNAVKYTQDGFVRLSVNEASRKDGEITLNFVISDSGIGIRPEDIGSIFGDFVRVDAERNSGVEGTGLGLSISRSLCRAMGGDISAASVYGKGSEFTVTLPQFYDTAEAVASVNEREKIRVLLYHEHPRYAESISSTLESLGVVFRRTNEPPEFFHELEGGGWSHAFAPAPEADEAKETVRKNLLPTKVALLANIGDALSPSGLSSVMAPAWAVPIANLLNGVNLPLREKSLDVRFIAPAARILIVDDIATNLQVVNGLLSPYRMKADTCVSGAEAVELVREREYDMILMDHMMPGMDGIEATKRIRELGGERFAKLPIIALTANAISGMREKFLQSGFDDYLAKPIEISKLNDVMERWIPGGKRVKSVRYEPKGGAEPPVEIGGVDTARGMAMTGGTREGYLKVLRLYVKDAAERLVFLREFEEKMRGLPPHGSPLSGSPPDDSSLSLFVTQAHALKSASASIGAAEISRDAAALETAGKNRDMETIASELGAFCDGLASLAERVGEAVREKDGG